MKEVYNSRPAVGILEWFRPGEHDQVRQVIDDMNRLGFKHIRTGISWADSYEPSTQEWYDWLFPELAKHFEILPCFHYTPPSIGEEPKISSPPKDLKAYADFLDVMIDRYGEYFTWVELWNEPNNRLEYDFTMDYSWFKFSEMIGQAAHWAQHKGKKTVLGGMSPIDPNWLQVMFENGVLQYIDAVGIHGFPEVYDQQWSGWENNVNRIREVIDRNNLNCEIWITEAGFSTWQHDEVKQWQEFKKVMEQNVSRVYWYSMNDLNPAIPSVGGFHLDERDYHFGLKRFDGTEKLLFKLLSREKLNGITSINYIDKKYSVSEPEMYSLITGGAGFVGTNVASRLLSEGKRVMIYDNISRDGVEQNLQWLKQEYGDKLIVQIADITEKRVLEDCVRNASEVFHFSAQVAVTSSLTNPEHDFRVNIEGTFNVLEAIRKAPHQPPLIFTSTNKVYGDLEDLSLKTNDTRYYPESKFIRENGVDESRPLDFHSPYGCSKGAADQYILDYARSYGLKTVVFRMSCIYGPHQFGTEDQGWVAHFLIRALERKPITIYGNGKQVRDILFVEDLVDAFMLASKNMNKIAGQVFNIGGGPENTISLREILDIIKDKTEQEMDITYEGWRTGDQFYYVSNTSKFSKATGWSPKHNVSEGIEALMLWLCENRNIELKVKQNPSKAVAI
ncbi:MAG TPA: GDP-mannose 4,6-dehydratase [Flavobacterium sp.]